MTKLVKITQKHSFCEIYTGSTYYLTIPCTLTREEVNFYKEKLRNIWSDQLIPFVLSHDYSIPSTKGI